MRERSKLSRSKIRTSESAARNFSPDARTSRRITASARLIERVDVGSASLRMDERGCPKQSIVRSSAERSLGTAGVANALRGKKYMSAT